MKIYLTILSCFILTVTTLTAQSSDRSINRSSFEIEEMEVLAAINQVRTRGCKCGRKRMKPTHALTWNKTLTKSAYLHAEEMDRYDFFAHRSRSGLDIGERLDKLGYKWQYVGENLAVGQKSFYQALTDWIESPSHCKMLMNPDMKEMGLSRVGKYWVHHFGTKMPPRTKRIRTHYREGE